MPSRSQNHSGAGHLGGIFIVSKSINKQSFFKNSGPSGKPRVTAAHNTSSTSLFISWQPPDFTTIHGEFEGFKISYRPRDVAQAKSIEIPIENPKAKVGSLLIEINSSSNGTSSSDN